MLNDNAMTVAFRQTNRQQTERSTDQMVLSIGVDSLPTFSVCIPNTFANANGPGHEQ